MIEALTPVQIAQFEKLCEECSRLRLQADRNQRLAEIKDGILTDLLQLALAEPVSVRNLQPGTRLDDYELVERLGGGGFGEVWRAHRSNSGAPDVAIKLVRLEHLQGGDAGRFLAYFREEIRRHGALDHPGIVKLLAAGSAVLPGLGAPVPYLVMELWPGLPLHHACRGRTVAEKIGCLIQACEAVQHAHRHGLMHLDLKPENILVVEAGGELKTKILDFGLARAFRADQPAPANRFGAGTLPYQAPEQIDRALGGEDFRTDVHALGVILFQLLTDHLPYSLESDTVSEFRRFICLGPRLKLKAFDQSFDDPLQVVCERAMAIERSQRFDSPAGLAAALRRWLGLRTRLAQRSRMIAFSAVLALVIVSAFAVRSFMQRGSQVPSLEAPMRIGANSNSIAAKLSVPIFLERFPIRIKGNSQVNPDECSWTDLEWYGKEGWLCGDVDEQSGTKEFIGHGVLLHTSDGGQIWEEISRSNFDAGAGTVSCFEGKTWDGLAPIHSIAIKKEAEPDGRRTTNGWVTTLAGIFFCAEAGNPAGKWTRITPPPDGPGCYSHFSGMQGFDDYQELYAYGWQGISHWAHGVGWQVEMKTHTYPINCLTVVSLPYREIWAVGGGGPDALERTDSVESTGAVYRFASPGTNWERVALPGVEFQPGEKLNWICKLPNSGLLLLGDGGLVIRSSMQGTNRVWSASRLAMHGLNFATSDSEGILWVLGIPDTILRSADKGVTWVETPCYRKDGSRIRNGLSRVKFDGDGRGWLLNGNGLLTYTP